MLSTIGRTDDGRVVALRIVYGGNEGGYESVRGGDVGDQCVGLYERMLVGILGWSCSCVVIDETAEWKGKQSCCYMDTSCGG